MPERQDFSYFEWVARHEPLGWPSARSAEQFARWQLEASTRAGSRPTIVAFMGHGKVAQLLDEPGSYQKALAATFARDGHLVYAMENVGMGPDADTHLDLDQAMRLFGWSWYSLLFGHLRMLLDGVFRDAAVDTQRVGVTGVSTGGFLSLVAAALDTRVAAASVHGFWGAMRELFIEDRALHCRCGAVAGLLPDFDLPTLAALVAPRPLHFPVVGWSPDQTIPSERAAEAGARPVPCSGWLGRETKPERPYDPELIPHRGLAKFFPENTLPSFAAAAAAVMGAELDVYETNDGQVVVLHDPKVDRTTEGRGEVTRMPFADVRALDAGRWFHPAFTAVQIPTLREALQTLRERSLRPTPIAIQMKQQHDSFVAKVAAIMREEGVADRAFLFAFEPRDAKRVKDLVADVQVVVAARKPEELASIALDLSADGAWLYFVPTVEQANVLRQGNKRIYVSPLVPQNEETYRRLLSARVTAVCTDHPFECRRMWAAG